MQSFIMETVIPEIMPMIKERLITESFPFFKILRIGIVIFLCFIFHSVYKKVKLYK